MLKVFRYEFFSRLTIKNCLEINIEDNNYDSDEFVLPIDETKLFFHLHETIE